MSRDRECDVCDRTVRTKEYTDVRFVCKACKRLQEEDELVKQCARVVSLILARLVTETCAESCRPLAGS